MKRKTDAQEIQFIIDELQKADWLDSSRSWWPRFLFHFTNINNAVKILENGKLLSRNSLKNIGGMITDNASADVIEQTDEKWKDYVRLYFRPRTPTQNKNEGYRPSAQRELNSHCPVPIYFLFDSKKLLTRKDVFFSKGSLAAGSSNIYSTAADFRQIPFQMVYHDSWFDPSERSSIIYHRHAEVVVRDKLELTELKLVWCRSEAEYKTLLNLLQPYTRDIWKDRIGAGKKGNLFFRKWIFVEEANLNRESISFKFNVPLQDFETVRIRIEINEILTGKKYIWEDLEYRVTGSLQLNLSNLLNPQIYEVALTIDDQIMFLDRYDEWDVELPF